MCSFVFSESPLWNFINTLRSLVIRVFLAIYVLQTFILFNIFFLQNWEYFFLRGFKKLFRKISLSAFMKLFFIFVKLVVVLMFNKKYFFFLFAFLWKLFLNQLQWIFSLFLLYLWSNEQFWFFIISYRFLFIWRFPNFYIFPQIKAN